MALGQNIKRLRKAKRLSQEALSALTGGVVSQGAISVLEKRDSSSSSFAKAIADALGVSLGELMAETPEGLQGGALVYEEGDALPDDLVLIPEYKVYFSAGNGHTIYELEESEPRVYRRKWFSDARISPKKAKRFKVRGNSMEPTLYAGDSVLVDEADNDLLQLIDGAIYALRYGNELRIKRLFRKLDGSLILHSDNPIYKQEELSPEMVDEHISIIGRVRDKSGAGGLLL